MRELRGEAGPMWVGQRADLRDGFYLATGWMKSDGERTAQTVPDAATVSYHLAVVSITREYAE